MLFDQPLEQLAHLIAEALSVKKDCLSRGIEVSAKLALRSLQPASPDRNDRMRAYRRVLAALITDGLTTETQRHRRR